MTPGTLPFRWAGESRSTLGIPVCVSTARATSEGTDGFTVTYWLALIIYVTPDYAER